MLTDRIKTWLKPYGPLGLRLVTLDQRVDDAEEVRPKWKRALKTLVDFCDKEESRAVLQRLLKDKHGSIRSHAASALTHLWEARYLIEYPNDHSYDVLDWTIQPLITAARDVREDPSWHAVRAASYMENATETVRRSYREALIEAGRSKFKYVRRAVAERLPNLYSSDDNAMHTLDEPGMTCMLELAKDQEYTVADWACFTLHLDIANLDKRAVAVFREALERDEDGGDLYLEALTGLARLTNEPDVVRRICHQLLNSDEFGSGWVDAAVISHDPDCLDALVAAYERTVSKWPNDRIVESLEEALLEWNGDWWMKDEFLQTGK